MQIDTITTTGLVGDAVTLTGLGFGSTQGSKTLLYYPVNGNVVAAPVTSWSDTSIQTIVLGSEPYGHTSWFAIYDPESTGCKSPTFITKNQVTPVELEGAVFASPGATGVDIGES